ncbi:MAG: R.Pab1 family restriction endonuclease [Candidatus Omnitrophica bacterium]|nr:R.Pab1 family restriction endonuclease [Candidatus Omnitrophota bacterium]
MKYIIKEKNIRLVIPANNAGKFRFKKRKNRLDFGETFSTREGAFDDQTYLEWQISYDVPVNDVEKGAKSTKLTSKHFVGANRKKKYPYELSEIFYEAMLLEFISKKEVENLLKEIPGYKNFIDEKAITVEHHAKLTINGMNFEETSIKLPTLFMVETLDETQIEVSVQKQQYASGVQPMVYFCIPLKAFKNSSDLHGKSSAPGDKLVYVISKANVLNLVYMMKVFGMASKRHNHDVVKILETLLEIIGG